MGLAPLMCLLAAAASDAPDEMRMVLLVDGQMSGQVRDQAFDALEILGALGRGGDRVGVVEVGLEPKVLLAPGSPGRLRARLAQARGQPFELEPTIDAALDLLGPRHPQFRDILVLVTERNPLSVDSAVLDRLTEDARMRRATVHVIALREEPSAALQTLARGTGGGIHARPKSLHATMFDIAVTEEGVDLLTTEGGAFRVDEDVDALAAVLTRSDGGDNTLLAPDESVLRGRAGQEGVRWMKRDRFDLVEVEAPVPGVWRADQPQLDQLLVAVRRGVTELDVQLEPQVPTVGAPAYVVGRLTQDGHPVLSYARLKALDMSFVLPDGRELPLDRGQEGRFVGRWMPDVAGDFRGTLRARAPTMQRHRRVRFRVSAPCFASEAEWGEDRVEVLVRRLPNCHDLAEVVVRAHLHPKEGSPTELGLRPEGDVFRGTLSFTEPPARLTLEARALEFGQRRRFTFEEFAAPDLAPPTSVWMTAARIGFAQAPLALIALGFWFRRRLDAVEAGVHV